MSLDDLGYMNFNVAGVGEGVLFTNGKSIPLVWKRDLPFDENLNYDSSVYAKTRYYDAKTGDEVILNKGKTWVCLVWDKYKTFTIY